MGAARSRSHPAGAAPSADSKAEASPYEDVELRPRTESSNKKCTQMSKICEVAASISL